MFLNKGRQQFHPLSSFQILGLGNVEQANSVYDMLNTGLSTQS